jgi:hypothetical protein
MPICVLIHSRNCANLHKNSYKEILKGSKGKEELENAFGIEKREESFQLLPLNPLHYIE